MLDRPLGGGGSPDCHLTWLTFGVLGWLRVIDLWFYLQFGWNLNTKIGP